MKFKMLNEKTEKIFNVNNDRKRLDAFLKKEIRSYGGRSRDMANIIEEIFTFNDGMKSIGFLNNPVTDVPSSVTVYLDHDSLYIVGELIGHLERYTKKRGGGNWDGAINFDIERTHGNNFEITCYDAYNGGTYAESVWHLDVIVL